MIFLPHPPKIITRNKVLLFQDIPTHCDINRFLDETIYTMTYNYNLIKYGQINNILYIQTRIGINN